MKVTTMERHRRGAAAVSLVVALVIINLVVIRMVVGGARDHDLTVRRMQTIEAFYAAEAGMNMAIRELIEDADEDSDGMTGTVSDDSPVDNANDPVLGNAQVVVKAVPDTPTVGQTTLTSQGRSGEARREMSAVME